MYHSDIVDSSVGDEKIKQINLAYERLKEFFQEPLHNSKHQQSSSNIFYAQAYTKLYRDLQKETDSKKKEELKKQEERLDFVFVAEVFHNPIFRQYHAHGGPKTYLNYKDFYGCDDSIIAYWKDVCGLNQQIIFKLFTLWNQNESFEDSWWKIIKLEKTILDDELSYLNSYVREHPAIGIESLSYIQPYVRKYLEGIEALQTKYSIYDLPFYEEVSKWRVVCIQSLIDDYENNILQNKDIYGYEEIKRIFEKGVATCRMYSKNLTIASSLINVYKIGQSEAGEFTYEVYREWRDKIGLNTYFSMQVDLFYSHVLSPVYHYYSNVVALKNAKLSYDYYWETAISELKRKIWGTEKLSITNQEMLALFPEPELNSEIDLEEASMEVNTYQEPPVHYTKTKEKKKSWIFRFKK